MGRGGKVGCFLCEVFKSILTTKNTECGCYMLYSVSRIFLFLCNKIPLYRAGLSLKFRYLKRQQFLFVSVDLLWAVSVKSFHFLRVFEVARFYCTSKLFYMLKKSVF